MFSCFFFKIKNSRHAQLLIYGVFHKKSDFQVKNEQVWRPEAKNYEKRNRFVYKKTLKDPEKYGKVCIRVTFSYIGLEYLYVLNMFLVFAEEQIRGVDPSPGYTSAFE